MSPFLLPKNNYNGNPHFAMMPPEHFFIGASIANIAYSTRLFLNRPRFSYTFMVLVCGITAMLPDIDSVFGHYMSRNPLIGHRGMTHSIIFALFAATVLSLLIVHIPALIINVPGRAKNRSIHSTDILSYPYGSLGKGGSSAFKPDFIFLFVIIFISWLSHIIADLPQPPGVWNGIPVFFPLHSAGDYIRHGGWSMIGWFDLKILWGMIAVFILSGCLLLSSHILRLFNTTLTSRVLYMLTIGLNIGAIICITIYISTAPYNGPVKWIESQTRFIETGSPILRHLTVKGKDAFLFLFRKVL